MALEAYLGLAISITHYALRITHYALRITHYALRIQIEVAFSKFVISPQYVVHIFQRTDSP